ncbi:Xaa-Pro aminopeptidase [Verrucomicrobium sp. GAS474]|uniref:M24 family metallopeptidase n=1 Tax=Verrucomicrobium sp. GAS474 TaxID=1882831 RepID=UPI000879FB28|nr:Xaa-Pro peptidase family protein [Verrucomicrobium sp. GAS474]SDU22080.1 Xaa-Pro aminopeptidase [Verrucomicrobium sp. GAS474]
MPPAARLIYAASDHDADLLYATRLSVPDPFLWLKVGRKTIAVLSPLEVDRARKNGCADLVLCTEDLAPAGKRTAADLVAVLAKQYRFTSVEVPESFPLGLAQELKKKRIAVRAVSKNGLFFPEREIKAEDEVAKITHALRLAEIGMTRAFEVLRASDVGPRRALRWGGKPLTSERLRGEIDAAIIREGGLPAGTIVAGGDQACDPHERGHGPLRADEAIILDIFPRDQRTGYFGDLTRTVVKGTPSPALEHLYATVEAGKKWVMKKMAPGVDGGPLHKELTARFAAAGYPTERKNGRWTGFFHGTGHSLGLEIHEPPRFGAGKFKEGHMMTVEPGLYIPGLGGVRLEDLVVVTKKGVRNLTRVEERLRL